MKNKVWLFVGSAIKMFRQTLEEQLIFFTTLNSGTRWNTRNVKPKTTGIHNLSSLQPRNKAHCKPHFPAVCHRKRKVTSGVLVSCHIAKDMVPAAIVEQVGFKNVLKTMDLRHELPSRSYFLREALPQMYTEVRQTLADRLANVSHFALTSDMWSSRTCGPYMSVTVHYIQDWEMKTACLQTSYFPQDHTGENIAEAL